jgi:hypothetical protein
MRSAILRGGGEGGPSPGVFRRVAVALELHPNRIPARENLDLLDRQPGKPPILRE